MDVTGAFKITSQQLSHATRHYHQRTRETVISHMSFPSCKAVAGRPTDRRNRLAPKRADMLLFLKHNLPLINYKY